MKTFCRWVISLGLLVGIVCYIRPEQLGKALVRIDARLAIFTVLLTVPFLFCRMAKWFLLCKQLQTGSKTLAMVRRYLWGMAVGIITPGRLGELARTCPNTDRSAQAALFLLEKALDVICLAALCLLSLAMIHIVPVWALILLFLVLTIVMLLARSFAAKFGRWVHQRFGWQSKYDTQTMYDSLKRTRICSSILMSICCFAIFIFQCFLMLHALGYPVHWQVMGWFPLILAANVLPITIGGFGIREWTAVWILQAENIPPAVAANSVFVVSVSDLVLPAVVGVVLHALICGNRNSSVSIEEDSAADKQWKEFWQRRKQSNLGQLLNWGRRTFVTPALAKLVEQCTPQGTLIEAGCGSGEIPLIIARKRGDSVVLVDYSDEALEIAKANAEHYGVSASLIKSDILELEHFVRATPDSVVFNVGVIEHFEDPANVLRQMASVSGKVALAVIPQRSLFWYCFIGMAKLTGLVPRDFLVKLYSRKMLCDVVNSAGLEVLGTRQTRILKIIPYLGVIFRTKGVSE